MSKQYLAQARLLRQRIPIGLLEALQMLAAVDGDLNRAEQQAQTAYSQQIQEKTGIIAAVALEKLHRLHYDSGRVLDEVAREQHRETELVLQRYATRKAEALPRLYAAIAHATLLEREQGWLLLGHFSATLSPPQYCVVVLSEWIEYADYEGFDYALCFWPDEVAGVITQQLRLPEVASYLWVARHRQEHFWASVKTNDQQQAFRAASLLARDPAFRAAEQGFDQSRQLLLETLYDYVQERVTEFP
ncbi:hypothetical protein A0257_19825 [Hymenobacter psoromatis]|nr:hypothetical protein A0257_19825 [Hymenobacter psoromatis]